MAVPSALLSPNLENKTNLDLRSAVSEMREWKNFYCQARVQSPNQKPTKSLKEEKKKGFGLRGDTKITWATHPPPLTFNHEGVL